MARSLLAVRRMKLHLALIALAGCQIFPEQKPNGQLNLAIFTWEDDTSVPIENAAQGGATTTISAQLPAGRTFSSVTSSHPEVAAFSMGQFGVNVTTGLAGDSDLSLLDASGALIDRVTVHVVPTATLDYKRPWTGATPQILAGAVQEFQVTTLDASGKVTEGTGSVTFSWSGSIREATDDELLAAAEMGEASIVTVGDSKTMIGQVGSGTIAASCPSAEASLDVSIVPVSAITSVVLHDLGSSNGQVKVEAIASTADGPVYGAHCAWTSGGQAVGGGSIIRSLLDPPGEQLELYPQQRTNLTCTIGSASATITITP